MKTAYEWRAMLRIHCEKLKLKGRWAPQHLKATEVLDLLDDADELRRAEGQLRRVVDGVLLPGGYVGMLEDRNAAKGERIERLEARIAELERLVREWKHRVEEQLGMITEKDERIAELENALREIAKGEGEFSRDPSEHAWNTIVNMKGLAMAALGEG